MKLSFVVVKNFLVGSAVVGVLVVSPVPVQAALSLTLSDGNPLHEQVLTDSASPGTILFFGGTVGNWSIQNMSGVFVDSQPTGTLDLGYGVRGSPGNNSILTVTLTETGYKPPGASLGDMFLALGGIGGASSVAQTVFINGLVVGSQGSLSGSSFHGDTVSTVVRVKGDEFTISEQLVFMGTGHNGGDSELNVNVATVPEPGTAFVGVFAGACGFSVIVARVFQARRRRV